LKRLTRLRINRIIQEYRYVLEASQLGFLLDVVKDLLGVDQERGKGTLPNHLQVHAQGLKLHQLLVFGAHSKAHIAGHVVLFIPSLWVDALPLVVEPDH
jgi:hypothetical protein